MWGQRSFSLSETSFHPHHPFFYTFYFLCMCLYVHIWRLKGNFWELIFLLHHMGHQGWQQAPSPSAPLCTQADAGTACPSLLPHTG